MSRLLLRTVSNNSDLLMEHLIQITPELTPEKVMGFVKDYGFETRGIRNTSDPKLVAVTIFTGLMLPTLNLLRRIMTHTSVTCEFALPCYKGGYEEKEGFVSYHYPDSDKIQYCSRNGIRVH